MVSKFKTVEIIEGLFLSGVQPCEKIPLFLPGITPTQWWRGVSS
jgi:hypothetical protein